MELEQDLKVHKRQLPRGQGINLKVVFLIGSYLLAIITANLLVVRFGPGVTIINAFLFIGFDLVARDGLHDAWRGRNLLIKMAMLIAAGSLLSYWLNRDAGQIALASFAAFMLAGIADATVYAWLHKRGWLIRVNGSNVAGAALDSVVFPMLAFGGFPVLIIIGQFVAKIGGGFLWSLIIPILSKRRNE